MKDQIDKWFDYVFPAGIGGYITFTNITNLLELLAVLGAVVLVWLRVWHRLTKDGASKD